MNDDPDAFRTKEGIEVAPRQVWRDLDKRMNGRLVLVVSKGNMTFLGKVRVQRYTRERGGAGPLRWLSVQRMHRHSTGFEFVEALGEAPTVSEEPKKPSNES